MLRMLALCGAVLLGAHVAAAAVPGTTIDVAGVVGSVNNLSAHATVGTNGSISGYGTLSGTNPQNGYKYSYPFYITGGSTAQDKVILTGKMSATNGPAVKITATVPQGPLAFTYTYANGSSYTMTGTGTVTVKAP